MKEDFKDLLFKDTGYCAQNVDDTTLNLVIGGVKAFARSTYQGVYVVDLFKKKILYVSDNFDIWLGVSHEEFKRKGLVFYLENMTIEDRKVLREVNSRGMALFNRLPLGERGDCSLSYDFHIMCGKKKRLIHHLITPLLLSEEGQIKFVLCSISLPHRNAAGHYVVHSMGAKSYYEYMLEEHKWKKKHFSNLGEFEHDVLALSAQGYTMTEIADVLCRSLDTVKACKKKLFSKLGVRNIASALSFATNFKM